MGLPGELIKVVDSYVAHRAFGVIKDGAVSEWEPILAAVPQGSLRYLRCYRPFLTSPTEVCKPIAELKVSKAPGPNGVPKKSSQESDNLSHQSI